MAPSPTPRRAVTWRHEDGGPRRTQTVPGGLHLRPGELFEPLSAAPRGTRRTRCSGRTSSGRSRATTGHSASKTTCASSSAGRATPASSSRWARTTRCT